MKAIRRAFCCAFVALTPLTILAQEQQFSQAQLEKMPYVWDHSFRYFTFSGTLEQAIKSHADIRVIMQLYQRHALKLRAEEDAKNGRALPHEAGTIPGSYPIGGKTSQVLKNRKIDWSVSLGVGTVAPYQYPSVFRPSWTTPDCVNDYVAYALNVPGVTGGQANLVGINELYSGTNPTGLCGTAPHVNWAYNGSTAGGRILGSPVYNFLDTGITDGTKIAYVESTANSAIFHVLTWKAGEGTSALKAARPLTAGNCTATSSCLTSVTFSTKHSSTYSGPMVDWRSDEAWVSSDDGTIYQLSCAFTCPLNTNPTIQWSFKLPVAGSGGALPTPTEVAYDLNKKLIGVSDVLGEMWIINDSGPTPTLYVPPYMVGGGGCTTANPPGRTGTPNPCTANGGSYSLAGHIEDQSVFKYYLWTGNDGTPGASAAVVNSNDDLTSVIRTPIGIGSVGNTTTNVDIAFPTWDEGYWKNTQAAGHMYICGTGTTDTTPYLYTIGFSAWPEMDSTSVQAPFPQIPVPGIPCSPLTAVYNPNINLGGNPNDHDLLVSGLMDPTNGYIITTDISNGPAAEITLNYVPYAGGISGTWWDNISTEPQASSVYFATIGTNSACGTNAHCAVKLTQLNLN